jgi:LysM repeat protein
MRRGVGAIPGHAAPHNRPCCTGPGDRAGSGGPGDRTSSTGRDNRKGGRGRNNRTGSSGPGDRTDVVPRYGVVGRAALSVAAFAAVVGGMAWASAGIWQQMRRPGPASFDTLIAAGAAAAAWVSLAWLTVGFLLAALASLPTRGGRWCATASSHLAPAAVRRLACVVVGGALISGTGLAETLPASAASSAAVPAASPQLPDLDRPVGRPGASSSPASPAADPGLGAASDSVRTASADPTRLRFPDSPVAEPTTGLAAPSRQARATPEPVPLVASPSRAPRSADEVVVHRGDTLWGIAARRLGPRASVAEIAAEWPRWHAANRRVIGGNPHLIRPGQRLRVPAPAVNAEETR